MKPPLDDRDIRPRVASPRRDLPLAIVALLVAAGAIALFRVLDARRLSMQTSGVQQRIDAAGAIGLPPPPLMLPRPRASDRGAVSAETTPAPSPSTVPVRAMPPAYVPPVYTPPAVYQAVPAPQTYIPGPAPSGPSRPAGQNDPTLVIDTTAADTPTQASSGEPGAGTSAGSAAGGSGQQRSRAVMLRRQDTIVTQGALIPAVLESALNSSQPGLARAIVSRDVRGFDGTRILIPRGSRLIGEYRSDLTPGQKRAFLNWTRLVRPDGASISLGSPASDPLGRAGIAGKVDNHFFERFGSAILRSVLDVGVNVASARIGGSPVIVGLPGSVGGGLSQSVTPASVAPPTVTVRQGTAISVFVARDLDFTAVEARK